MSPLSKKLPGLSLLEAACALKNREFSVLELTEACLERIKATETRLCALLTLDAENALALARSLDAEGPNPAKPLWGIPVTVKDALSTKNLRTTAASRILENFVPIYDAYAVQKLREAGAIILAKTNMDEFAMGSATENSVFQKTHNPWDLGRVPGGSSGGSAASVASGQCFASLGSDTGGSIRQPASFCGCVGLKPSYGRVSRYGLFAFASSLDQVGPLARTVKDCAQILEVIAGYDSRDNTCAKIPAENYSELDAHSEKPLFGIRLGIPKEFFGPGLDAEVRDACNKALSLAEDLGAEIVEISLPHVQAACATYYVLAMAEASSNLARYDGVRYGRRAPDVHNLEDLYERSRSEGLGAEVKRRIMLGTYVLSSGYYDAYFRKAAQVRRLIRQEYLDALEYCDAIVSPVAPVTAWPLGSHTENPLQAYLLDAYTLPVNLAGLPGLSLPVGLGHSSSMPVGLQIVGPAFAEHSILKIAYALEQALPGLGPAPC